VAMGSPSGPLFANIFLSFDLNICHTTFKPLIYRCYVDDCFSLFHSADHVPQFLSFLNSQHPNIKFTCEIESNSTLPFLDISIAQYTRIAALKLLCTKSPLSQVFFQIFIVSFHFDINIV
jgi:hypothetical protein